jgi:hypothetical protein
MHRRATFNEKHNEHVLIQMARSVDALFQSAEHTGRLFRFGLNWKEDHWATWVPKKNGAETTGVGHYMEAQDWLTKDVYEQALENAPGIDTDKDKLIAKFWNEKREDGTAGGYVLPFDHPYRNKVKGQILPSDEYQTDTFDEVMLGMHATVGCEIGPVARLFHFHMLLDVKHLSKIQVDQRAFKEFFLGCWCGTLFNGDYMIKDTSGNSWIPPHEKLYFDSRLQAEDEIGAAMDAYVQKQSMNYMAAGLRSIADANARRDKVRLEEDARTWFETTRAQVLMNQPRRVSLTTTVNDGLRTGLERRDQELTNLPSGSNITGTRGPAMRVAQPGLVIRTNVVQGNSGQPPTPAASSILNDTGAPPLQPLTSFEAARQARIAENNQMLAGLGLGPSASRQ